MRCSDGSASANSRRCGLCAEYQEQAEPWQIYSGILGPMLRGHRLFVLALGLILIGHGKPPEQGGQGEKPSIVTSTKQSLQDTATALNVANRPNRFGKPCTGGEDDRQSELCAQWRAADAAIATVFWAQGTFWVGIILGIGTLVAAVAAAVFAARAVDTAERALRDGERAFVYPDGVKEYGESDQTTDKITSWQFWFPWRNSGSTAAKRCEAQVNILYFEGGAESKILGLPPKTIPDWFPFDDSESSRVAFFLGPQAERRTGPAVVSVERLQSVYAGKARLFFYGWIKYSDVFGGDHESRFCLELNYFTGDPADSKTTGGYSHWKTFNCADDECEREDRAAYELMPPEMIAALRADGWKPRFEEPTHGTHSQRTGAVAF